MKLSLCCLILFTTVAASAEDLPSYRGADGSGCLADWQGQVITDIKQAKVIWTGEETNFGVGWGYGTGPENKNRTSVMGAGFSGPVAAGDAAFFSWFVPSGDIVDERVRKKGKDQRPESWKVDADDLLVCLNANTGKRRWKVAMAGKGLNWGYHRKCPWTHPCVVDGKVFWLGSAGKVYCHSVADGSLVWESDTAEGFAEFEKMRSKMRAAKSVETWQQGLRIKDGDNTSPNNSSPCYADGVIVINDSLCEQQGERAVRDRGVGLVGLDAKDGKLLWRNPASCGIYVSPIPHLVDGKTLVIAVAPKSLHCLDPKTGNIVWQIKAPMGTGVTPAVGNGYVLVQRHIVRGSMNKIPEGTKGLSCYKLVDGKAELAWEKEPGAWSGGYGAPAIIDGRGYAKTNMGLICVDLASGEQVGERVKAGDVYNPLTAANGIILASSDLVAATKEGPKLLGRIPVGREMYTTAFISAGRVYVRTRLPDYQKTQRSMPEPGCIVCIDLRE